MISAKLVRLLGVLAVAMFACSSSTTEEPSKYRTAVILTPPGSSASQFEVDEAGNLVAYSYSTLDGASLYRHNRSANTWHALDLTAVPMVGPASFGNLISDANNRLLLNVPDGLYRVSPTADKVDELVFPASSIQDKGGLAIVARVVDKKGRVYGRANVTAAGNIPALYRSAPGAKTYEAAPIFDRYADIFVDPQGTIFLLHQDAAGVTGIERVDTETGALSSFYAGCTTCANPKAIFFDDDGIAYGASAEGLDFGALGFLWAFDGKGPARKVVSMALSKFYSVVNLSAGRGRLFATVNDAPQEAITSLLVRNARDGNADPSSWTELFHVPTLSTRVGRSSQHLYFAANYFREISLFEVIHDED